MKKSKLSVYIDADVFDAIAAAARQRGISKSQVTENALQLLLTPDGADDREAVITKRIDRVQRQMETARDDIERLTEMLGLFVHVWFAHTPELPQAEKANANRTAAQRFQRFVDGLASNLRSGRSVYDRGIVPVRVDEQDYAGASLAEDP